MTDILINYEVSSELEKSLRKLDVNIYKTKENKNLLDGLKGHPDLLVHSLPKGNLVVDRDNYDYYKDLFKDYNIIKSEKSLNSIYPRDISLNAVVFKNLFIHNLKYTDKNLLEFYSKKGYKLIDVKQGYTKCNISIGKNVLITSDRDIYYKVKSFEKILLIDHKQIILPGFNYGFIGGASGLINDTLYFTGSLKNHSSYNEIIDFLEKNNEKYDFLTSSDIIDYGSILSLEK